MDLFPIKNKEYSNEDGHVADFMEPADYVLTVTVVLLVAAH